MIGIAISVLWFLIGLIVLAAIIWLAIWVIEQFISPIPERVKQAVWVIVLLLALIALLTVLSGGGGWFRHAAIEPGGPAFAVSISPGGHHA